MAEPEKGYTFVVIVENRYTTAYAGGKWFAAAISWDDQLPQVELITSALVDNGPQGNDNDAMNFWHDPPDWVAVGDTPDEALKALRAKGWE